MNEKHQKKLEAKRRAWRTALHIEFDQLARACEKEAETMTDVMVDLSSIEKSEVLAARAMREFHTKETIEYEILGMLTEPQIKAYYWAIS